MFSITILDRFVKNRNHPIAGCHAEMRFLSGHAVLEENLPSYLAEIGFITSDEDNTLFDENLDAYADEIAKGILETLGSMTEE